MMPTFFVYFVQFCISVRINLLCVCICRRSFIEHCTTVHNMKFRTKSGATISAQTAMQKAQMDAAKRKAEAMASTPSPATPAGTTLTPSAEDRFKRPRVEGLLSPIAPTLGKIAIESLN